MVGGNLGLNDIVIYNFDIVNIAVNMRSWVFSTLLDYCFFDRGLV